jgi:phage terminase small subunit
MGERNSDKLTGLQAAFCREYAIDFNGTRAAIAAGYAEKGAAVSASRLLIIAKINAEIDRLIDESLGTSRNRLKKQVLSLTKEIAEKTKETVDEKGESITDYKSADRDRLKALEMLGKYAGVFTEQCPVVEITNKYSVMTDEEIDKRLAELRDEIDKKR